MNLALRGAAIGLASLALILGCHRDGRDSAVRGTPVQTELANRTADPQPASPENAPARATSSWAERECTTSSSFPALVGRTAPELHEALGPPSRSEGFSLAERDDEFHIALQNTYPLSNPANASVRLEEQSWEHDNCRLTVWLHQVHGVWRALEVLRWPADADF